MNRPVMAIFGGAFDPPTIAHVQVLHDLVRHVTIDTILVVPSINHLFKTSSVSYQARLSMCRLAFPSIIMNTTVEVSDVESHIAHKHPNEKISTRMLYDYLVAQHKTHEIKCIIGVDNADTIDTWSSAAWVKSHIPFLVIPRGGYVPQDSWYRTSNKDRFIEEISPIEGSSTKIREALLGNHEELIKQSVMPEVLDFYKAQLQINN